MRTRVPARLTALGTGLLTALRTGLLTGLVALLAALALSVIPAGPAAAAPAKCPDLGLKQSLRAADAVLVGQVGGSVDIGNAWDSEVSLAWTYKGDPLSSTVTIRTKDDRCGLGRLKRGETYLFVLTEKRGVYVAGGDSGTAPLDAKLRSTVRSVLGPGQAVGATPPEPPIEVSFTQVADTDPASFWHAALPGFAIIGVSLIGWIVIRRLAAP